MARETADRFAEYSALVVDSLGDVIDQWITLDEPWSAAFLGYGSGAHAPGRSLGAKAAHAAHHLLLAHGRAVRALRVVRPRAAVGITINLCPVGPATGSPEDADAAHRIDGLCNRIFLDPILLGRYPDDVVADLNLGPWLDPTLDQDLEEISAAIDFVGVNYYFRHTVAAGAADAPPTPAHPARKPVRFVEAGSRRTQMGWPVSPEGIIDVLNMVARRRPYLPLFLTGGAAFADAPAGGAVHDPERRAFIEEHIESCRNAVMAGLPLRGYFIWTLMDNFEWEWGYQRRFGLVRVDVTTQERVVKDSGKWVRTFLRSSPQSPCPHQ